MGEDICPYFRETQEKVRNKDKGVADPYWFVKRARCRHESHPSNLPRTVLNGPKCGGDVTKCEIPDIWQT
jgi:hypothetical protein